MRPLLAAWCLLVATAARKKSKKKRKPPAAVYRPPEMNPSLARDGYIASDLANLAGRRDQRTRIPFWLVAGIEGTGHHFFDFVGHRLRYLSEPTELLPNFANEAYNDLQLCWLSLSTAKAHARCNFAEAGCRSSADFDGASCLLERAKLAARGNMAPWRSSLYVPGCSYPCGSPGGGDDLQHTSPDLPRYVAGARGAGYAPQVVVTVREPLATCVSSHFRRHHSEGTFKSTAFNLWLNLGLLDTHLRGLDPSQFLVVHYEELVSGHNVSAADALGDFLGGVDRAMLADALAYARGKAKGGSPSHKPLKEAEKRYVEHLFFRPSARPLFPTLWPHMQRYFGRRPKNARLRDADRYAFQVEADMQMASLMKRDEYHALHAWFDLFDEPNKAEVRAKPKGHGALLQKRQKAELYQASVRGAEVG